MQRRSFVLVGAIALLAMASGSTLAAADGCRGCITKLKLSKRQGDCVSDSLAALLRGTQDPISLDVNYCPERTKGGDELPGFSVPVKAKYVRLSRRHATCLAEILKNSPWVDPLEVDLKKSCPKK